MSVASPLSTATVGLRLSYERVLEFARRHGLAAGLATALATLYALTSIRRQVMFLTSANDLGIFTEAVKGYAEGRGPVVALKGAGFNLLGDHFSPVLATLAPFYALAPSPNTLLIAQAVLLALGAVPLVHWSSTALGRGPALGIGVAYGLSFGIASAVGFDFHEVAFAVPLIAWSLVALARGRLGLSAGLAVPLVFVKEDLGLTVAAIGGLIAWFGARKRGAALAAFGVLASVVEVALVIPAFSSTGHYLYGGQAPSLATAFADPTTKLQTLFLTFGIAGFICLRSPIVLVAIPTLLWRFTSPNGVYATTNDHYSAVLMPIVFIASVQVLVRWRTHPPRILRPGALQFVPGALALVALALMPLYPLSRVFSPLAWQPTSRAQAIEGALRDVPNGTPIATTNSLAAQLASRADVSLLEKGDLSVSRPQMILDDRVAPHDLHPGPAAVQRQELDRDVREHVYRRVYSRAGITLWMLNTDSAQ